MKNREIHYTAEKTHAAVLEEQERLRGKRCGESNVQAIATIRRGGIRHAGSVAHVCQLEKGHDGNHRCCDYVWKSR